MPQSCEQSNLLLSVNTTIQNLQEAKPDYFYSYVQSHWTQKRHLSKKKQDLILTETK